MISENSSLLTLKVTEVGFKPNGESGAIPRLSYTLTDPQTSEVIFKSLAFEPSEISHFPPIFLKLNLLSPLVFSFYMEASDSQIFLGSALIDLSQNFQPKTRWKIPSNGNQILSIEIEIIKEKIIEVSRKSMNESKNIQKNEVSRDQKGQRLNILDEISIVESIEFPHKSMNESTIITDFGECKDQQSDILNTENDIIKEESIEASCKGFNESEIIQINEKKGILSTEKEITRKESDNESEKVKENEKNESQEFELLGAEIEITEQEIIEAYCKAFSESEIIQINEKSDILGTEKEITWKEGSDESETIKENEKKENHQIEILSSEIEITRKESIEASYKAFNESEIMQINEKNEILSIENEITRKISSDESETIKENEKKENQQTEIEITGEESIEAFYKAVNESEIIQKIENPNIEILSPENEIVKEEIMNESEMMQTNEKSEIQQSEALRVEKENWREERNEASFKALSESKIIQRNEKCENQQIENLNIEKEVIKESIEASYETLNESKIMQEKSENTQAMRDYNKIEEKIIELLRTHEIDDINDVANEIEYTKNDIENYRNRKKFKAEKNAKDKLADLERLLILCNELKETKQNEETKQNISISEKEDLDRKEERNKQSISISEEKDLGRQGEEIKQNIEIPEEKDLDYQEEVSNKNISISEEEDLDKELNQGLIKYNIENPQKIQEKDKWNKK